VVAAAGVAALLVRVIATPCARPQPVRGPRPRPGRLPAARDFQPWPGP
jgi:hypothetical protein